MKKYDLNKMLETWTNGGSLSNANPYPADSNDPADVEDLAGNDSGTSSSSDMTTNIPGPTNPQNIPGPDRTKVVKEADGDPVKTTTPATPPQAAPPMTMSDGREMGQDMGDPSMGGDPSMMGMGMETPGPTNTFEVGRIYELKKIYSRLVSMQSYLAGTTDPNLIKLRNYVSSTIDLFKTLISNVTLYKDRLDEIIVVFYKVVDNVYEILSKYYKDKDIGKMVQAVE